jgi:predicted nucleic acid-binding protein
MNLLRMKKHIIQRSFKFKLMTNDAIHVATCKFYNIVDIATNDTDFQRVHFLRAWNP